MKALPRECQLPPIVHLGSHHPLDGLGAPNDRISTLRSAPPLLMAWERWTRRVPHEGLPLLPTQPSHHNMKAKKKPQKNEKNANGAKTLIFDGISEIFLRELPYKSVFTKNTAHEGKSWKVSNAPNDVENHHYLPSSIKTTEYGCTSHKLIWQTYIIGPKQTFRFHTSPPSLWLGWVW